MTTLSESPSVGIIGLGYGRAHISAFQANGCRVTALCQRDQAAAKTIADRYRVPHVFARWEELLDRARPEIVVIATPPHLHHAIALQALAAGAHVLCEKPLAMNRTEAQSMVDAADHCVVMAELASGAQATLAVSRVAHATNVQTLEAWGSGGALSYRLAREGARWFEGELRASRGSAGFQPVAPGQTPPAAAGEG